MYDGFCRDIVYWHASGSDIVSIWQPLDPISQASCLEFVRGSHLAGVESSLRGIYIQNNSHNLHLILVQNYANIFPGVGTLQSRSGMGVTTVVQQVATCIKLNAMNFASKMVDFVQTNEFCLKMEDLHTNVQVGLWPRSDPRGGGASRPGQGGLCFQLNIKAREDYDIQLNVKAREDYDIQRILPLAATPPCAAAPCAALSAPALSAASPQSAPGGC